MQRQPCRGSSLRHRPLVKVLQLAAVQLLFSDRGGPGNPPLLILAKVIDPPLSVLTRWGSLAPGVTPEQSTMVPSLSLLPQQSAGTEDSLLGATPDSSTTYHPQSLPVMLIVGLALIGILLIVLIVIVICLCRYRRQRRALLRSRTNSAQLTSPRDGMLYVLQHSPASALEEGLLNDHNEEDLVLDQGSRTATPSDLSTVRKDGEIMMHTVPSTDLAESTTADTTQATHLVCDEARDET
jgi:hypothetical protein